MDSMSNRYYPVVAHDAIKKIGVAPSHVMKIFSRVKTVSHNIEYK